MRGLIKAGIAGALHRTGADHWIGTLTRHKNLPLVVCYHRVVEDFASSAASSIPATLISLKTLEHHLDWIGRRYHFISLDEMESYPESGERFKKPVAAVTFDDGYREVYDHAFPLLKRKGIPAAVFVVTDLIGTSRIPVYDRLYLLLVLAFSTWRSASREFAGLCFRLGLHLPEIEKINHGITNPWEVMRALLEGLPPTEIHRVAEALEAEVGTDEEALKGCLPLNWEMLSEMHRTGITIGSHTKTHVWLTRESPERMTEEIAGSRQELERRLGVAIQHFAYPDGRFNPAVVDAVAASGYRFGYTTCPHRDHRHPSLTLPRLVLWENFCLDSFGRFSPAILSCHVNGIFRFSTGCRRSHRGPPLFDRAVGLKWENCSVF
jgi:peptidoglycan/xylan/chitin deacetylase (PgdA/CDA1 family)